MKINKELTEQRQVKLEETRQYLKTKFIGIDDIIDKFISSIRIWFLMPEIQTRPLIINLWGITGVGKTDLVRNFVNYIGFADRFCEIQLDSKDGNATIQDYLEMVFDDGEQQGVLLLDEIQRFRSIDEEGKENNSTKFQDLWMLLSDGTFQSNSKIKSDLIRMILEDDYWSERYEEDEADDEDEDAKKKKKMFKLRTHYWEASQIKKMLKSSESVEDIMKWNQEDKIKKIKEKLASKEVFEGTKYTRLLVIISGNLDEAYYMASDVEDADRDADVYHEYSKTINIIQIKAALKKRFKPEQIARLGNMHMIYPILNKAGYYNIIKQKSQAIIKNIENKHKITIDLDNSIYDVIYANGVFPTQGVRPLLSTISSILENALPTFIFYCIQTGSTKKKIKLTHKDGYIHSVIGGETIMHEIPRVLDDIKKDQTLNHKALIAVHEAGHAVLYALLYKTSPTQIVASTTNFESDGFVGTHPKLGSKTDKLKTMQVTFGGRIAEHMVFGDDMITGGAGSDYDRNTAVASNLVRALGMSVFTGTFHPPASHSLHDINRTDDIIEGILKEQYQKAKDLLARNEGFLMDVASALMLKSTLTPEEFKLIADRHIKEGIVIKSAKDMLEENYYEKLMDKKQDRDSFEAEVEARHKHISKVIEKNSKK